MSLISSEDEPGNKNGKFIKIKLNEKVLRKLDEFPDTFSFVIQSGYAKTGIRSIDRLSKRYDAVRFRRIFPYAGKFEKRHEKYGLHLWYEIQFADSLQDQILSCLKQFQRNRFVELSEPVYLKRLVNPVPPGLNSTSGFEIKDFPKDPFFELQWSLSNIGQNNGAPNADINMKSAWDIETGDSSVIVAVIDGGIDINHNDLKGAIWVNLAEKNGSPGVDDDLNGYVDDINGYNFAEDKGKLIPNYHGTHVAGTIGAITNNGIGISGIAGGDGTGNGVRLMSCEVFSDNDANGFEQSFVYAADMGAVIAQNSWGYIMPDYCEKSVIDGINYFIENAGYDMNNNPSGPMQGGVVMFAAGNDNDDGNWYPAYYEPVIAVAATDNNDKKASFSNFGNWVDISAPGVGIQSAFPGNNFESISGTSMACPHVSGVAALILSKYGKIGFTADSLKSKLLLMADNVDALNPSYSGQLGKGRINAFRSLLPIDTIPPAIINDLKIIDSTATAIHITWTAPGNNGYSGQASFYELLCSDSKSFHPDSVVVTQQLQRPAKSGIIERYEFRRLKSNTTYYFKIRTSDHCGNSSVYSLISTATTLAAPAIRIIDNNPHIYLDMNSTGKVFVSIENTGNKTLLLNIPEQDWRNYSDTLLFNEVIRCMKSDQIEYKFNNVKPLFGLNSIDNEICELNPNTGIADRTIYIHPKVSGSSDGLAYDGKFLYFASENALIYKIDLEKKEIVDTIVSNGIYGIDGLACSGNSLFVSSYLTGKIYELDNISGSITKTISTPLHIGGGITFGGQDSILYTSDIYNNDIYKVSLKSNSIVDTLSVGIKIDGLAYSGSNHILYAGSRSDKTVTLIDPETGLIIGELNSPFISGLASDEFYSPKWLQTVNVKERLAPGESSQIKIDVDVDRLNAGIYSRTVHIFSNDPVVPVTQIDVKLHIKGEPDLEFSQTEINFLPTILNKHDTINYYVINSGYDTLRIENINLNSPPFSLHNAPVAAQIPPKSKILLKVNFSPTETLTYNSELIFTNISGDSLVKVPVKGTGILPPVLFLKPDSINIQIESGKNTDFNVSINNKAGKSILKTEQYIQSNKFNKTVSNIIDSNPFPADALPPIVYTGIYNYKQSVIDTIPFKEDFETDSIKNWVLDCNPGLASIVRDNPALGSKCLYMEQHQAQGHFSGLHKDFLNYSRPSYIGYYIKPGSTDKSTSYFLAYSGSELLFYVFAHQSGLFYLNPTGRWAITKYDAYFAFEQNVWYHFEFKNINWDTRTFDFYVNNELLAANAGFLNNQSVPGLSRIYLYNYSSDSHSWWDEFYIDDDPVLNWLSIMPQHLNVNVGDSSEIILRCNAVNMNAGSYQSQMILKSNDPDQSIQKIPISVKIIGFPGIEIDKDSLNFDLVSVGHTIYDTLLISNPGSDTLIITEITAENPAFQFDSEIFRIKPGDFFKLPVSLCAPAPGEYQDTLRIKSNLPNDSVCTILMVGNAEYPPSIQIDADTINVILNKGDSASFTLNIENNSDKGTLRYEVGKYYSQFYPNSSALRYYPIFRTFVPYSQSINKLYPLQNYKDNEILLLSYYSDNGGITYYVLEDYFNLTVEMAPAYDLGKLDLSKYKMVITSADKWEDYYEFLSNYQSKLLSFVENGGILYYSSPSYHNYTLAGGTRSLYGNLETSLLSSYNDHPIVNTFNDYISSQFPMNWEYFENLLPGTLQILKTAKEKRPVFIEYCKGKGTVVANTLRTAADWLPENLILRRNALKYAMWLKYSNWLSVANISDDIAPVSNKQNKYLVNATGSLFPGKYQSILVINSNDPVKPNIRIPVNLTVVSTPEISVTSNLNMRSCFRDQIRSDSILVKNTGDDLLRIHHLLIDNVLFKIDTSSFWLQPDESRHIGISFSSNEEGNYTGTLSFQTNDPNKDTVLINVACSTIRAPKFVSDRDSVYFSLKSNDTASTYIRIKNLEGDCNLNYQLTNNGEFLLENLINFDDVIAPDVYHKTRPLRNEYKYLGITFEGQDMGEGAAIMSRSDDRLLGGSSPNALVVSSYSWNQGPIIMKFNPPITHLDTKIFNHCSTKTKMIAYDGQGLIIDSISILPPFSSFIYKELSGDNIKKITVSSKCDLIVMDDICYHSWLDADLDSGSIEPGGEQLIRLSVNSRNMKSGLYRINLVIQSNDPENSRFCIPVYLKVTGESSISIDKTELNFGASYIPGIVEDYISVSNPGLDTLEITSITSTLPTFESEISHINILPRAKTVVPIDFKPTENIKFIDTLVLRYGPSADNVSNIPLEGQGIIQPLISVTPEHFETALNPGDSIHGNICVSNINDTCSLELKIGFPDSEKFDWNYKNEYDRPHSFEYVPRILVIGRSDYFTNTYLERFCLKVDKVNSVDYPDTIKYHIYDLIIIPGYLNSWYTNIILNEYVKNGGIIFYTMGNIYTGVAFNIAGNVKVIPGSSEAPNEVVDLNHPGFTYCNRLIYNDQSTVNVYHFENLILNTRILTRTFTSKLPTTIEFNIGNGLVLASTLRLESMQEDNTGGSKILMNLLYYILSQRSNRWLTIKGWNESFAESETKCFPFTIKTAGLKTGDYSTHIDFDLSNNISIASIPFTLRVQTMPELTLTSNKLNFGYVNIGNEKAIDIRLSNSGQETLISQFAISGAEVFSVIPENASINPGETKELQITFKPTEDKQYYHSFLNISSNDPARPELQVKLEGNTGGINGTINQDLSQLQVSPNPTDGLFSVSGEYKGSELTMKIFDPQGKIIRTQVIKPCPDFHEEIDIRSYPKGIYLLQIESEGNIWVYKITLI